MWVGLLNIDRLKESSKRSAYLCHTLVKLIKFFKNNLANAYPQIEFKFCFKNSFKISSSFRFKDKLFASLCSTIIHEFTCDSCQESYIGSTRKQAKIRFCQHLAIYPRTDNPVTVPQHSAPRDLCHSNSHPFKCNNFTIIDSAASQSDLRILESLYIFKCRPSLNSDQSSVSLHCF